MQSWPHISHPADDPSLSAAWAALRAVLAIIGSAIRPAGNGAFPIPLAAHKQVRRVLREAEGRLRRLLLPMAESLATHWGPLPPARTKVGAQAHPQSPARANPAMPGAAARPSALFDMPLHETGQASTGTNSPAPRRAAIPDPFASPEPNASRPDSGDHFGTRHVCARAEFRRYCALIVAMDHLDRPVRRLANILRRRTRRGLLGPPWNPGWIPASQPDLSDTTDPDADPKSPAGHMASPPVPPSPPGCRQDGGPPGASP